MINLFEMLTVSSVYYYLIVLKEKKRTKKLYCGIEKQFGRLQKNKRKILKSKD